MSDWPKIYGPELAPPWLIALAKQLMQGLLMGEHPTLSTLRAQYQAAQIKQVEITGHGFFIHYQVPSHVACVSPGDFQGGSANIQVAGMPNGADCMLIVGSGQIEYLEGYALGDEWPPHAEIVAVRDICPLRPGYLSA